MTCQQGWVRALTIFACAAGLLCGVNAAIGAAPYVVVDLGPVQSTGDSGKDVNEGGTVAFTRSTEVYLYENATITPVYGLTAGNGPLDINDAGHLAGSTSLRSYIYRNGTMTDLGTLESNNTFTGDINNSDIVVGYSYRSSGNAYRAYVWNEGVMSQLPAPTMGGIYPIGSESIAHAINHAGVIAGSYNNQNPGGVAVRWTGGVATPMATLGGYSRSEAHDINEAGQAVGYSADANFFTRQAVIWNGATPTSLGSLPGGWSYTAGHGINNLGMVVGEAKQSSGDPDGRAFLWTMGQMQNLNDLISPGSGWTLRAAYAINDDGWIVGHGTLNGSPRSFVLVPEPSMVCVIGMGLIVMCRRRVGGR